MAFSEIHLPRSKSKEISYTVASTVFRPSIRAVIESEVNFDPPKSVYLFIQKDWVPRTLLQLAESRNLNIPLSQVWAREFPSVVKPSSLVSNVIYSQLYSFMAAKKPRAGIRLKNSIDKHRNCKETNFCFVIQVVNNRDSSL